MRPENKVEKLAVSLPPGLKSQAKDLAAKRGTTLSGMITDFLESEIIQEIEKAKSFRHTDENRVK